MRRPGQNDFAFGGFNTAGRIVLQARQVLCRIAAHGRAALAATDALARELSESNLFFWILFSG